MFLYHKDHEGHSDGPKKEDFAKKNSKVRIVPKKRENRITFHNFLNFFPPVELPYMITSDTQRLISPHHEPLSAEWMFEFVLGENDVIDEFTEFMPCFSIPHTDDFLAIVYWEAGIDGTTYHLVTYAKSGVVIDKKKIAGTKYKQDGLMQMVCTIGEDLMISCVEGKLDAAGNTAPVDTNNSHHHTYLQLSSEGEIVNMS